MEYMNYELVLKLKENGFIFKTLAEVGYAKTAHKIDGVIYVEPTLSELIEALPKTKSRIFQEQRQICDFNLRYVSAGREWWAGYVWEHGQYAILNLKDKPINWKPCKEVSKTPEEAVAKLWLELNKKKCYNTL